MYGNNIKFGPKVWCEITVKGKEESQPLNNKEEVKAQPNIN